MVGVLKKNLAFKLLGTRIDEGDVQGSSPLLLGTYPY